MNQSVNPLKFRQVLPLFICSALVSPITYARSELPTIDSDERKIVVERISEIIIKNYVFPDVAERSATHIQRQLKSGAYDELYDAETYAKKLTEDLQRVNHDKHMRVRIRKPERARIEREDPKAARARRKLQAQQENYGFKKVEIMDGNVGYLDFRRFSSYDMARRTAAGALEFLSNSDAIIVDMRKNGGGSPAMVQFVCSYFFGEKTHLNSLYWRRGDRTQEFWTLDEIPGKRLPDVPLFVLTSKRTFSGAEEFTYNWTFAF